MPTTNYLTLVTCLQEVDLLLARVGALRLNLRLHRQEIELLKRAVIALTSAGWEGYIEGLCDSGLDHLVRHAPSPAALPTKLKAIVYDNLMGNVQTLFGGNAALAAWSLADAGWRNVLQQNLNDAKDKLFRDGFNNAKSEPTRLLFEQGLGIRNITAVWQSSRLTVDQSKTLLDEFITVRGKVVHGASFSARIKISDCRKFRSHVVFLAKKTDAAVVRHLVTTTGVPPI